MVQITIIALALTLASGVMSACNYFTTHFPREASVPVGLSLGNYSQDRRMLSGESGANYGILAISGNDSPGAHRTEMNPGSQTCCQVG